MRGVIMELFAEDHGAMFGTGTESRCIAVKRCFLTWLSERGGELV